MQLDGADDAIQYKTVPSKLTLITILVRFTLFILASYDGNKTSN